MGYTFFWCGLWVISMFINAMIRKWNNDDTIVVIGIVMGMTAIIIIVITVY